MTIKIKGKENRMEIIQECEQLYRAVLKGREILLGIEHPDTMLTVNQLASLLYDANPNATSKKIPMHQKCQLVHTFYSPTK